MNRANSGSGHGGEDWMPLLESYSSADAGFSRFDVRGMGTQNVFLVRGESGETFETAVQEAFHILDRLEQRLSKFLPESDVTLVNRLASRAAVPVGEDLFFLLSRAKEAWELSGGIFDPTVGPLLSAWGFVDMEGRVPDEREIERLLRACGMHHVELDEARSTVRLDHPGVSIDLGGIGKGYAADRIAEHLRASGATCGAVICGRSTVLTWGTPPGDAGWRFEVVHPLEPSSGWSTLRAEAGAMSSSGAYERRFRRGDTEYGHVFDPRTGRPSAGAVRGATVWTRTALLGDVLSTILFVAGEEVLRPGGCAERLAGAWGAEGEPARLGVVLVEADAGRWGGLSSKTLFIGEPAFEVDVA